MIKLLRNYKKKNQKVLVRADLNLPLHDNKVLDYTRLDALKPTIDYLLSNNHKVVICSHLGRPDGKVDPSLSLKILIPHLEKRLNIKVKFLKKYINKDYSKELENLKENQIILLENLRFHKEEKENNIHFAEKLAKGFDIYVNEAFGVSHRSHTSNVGITNILPSYAGLLLETELNNLNKIKEGSQAKRPLTLIIGGAKMKTKTPLLREYLGIADNILIGGALANTFLKAQGVEIGNSLHEADQLVEASKIIELAKSTKTKIYLPSDLSIQNSKGNCIKNLDQSTSQDNILDIGPQTIQEFGKIIKKSKTIIFNGPLGLYVQEPFDKGTKEVFNQIKNSKAKTYLGGGDTVDALHDFNFHIHDFTHISTGGGAMLTYLEGKKMPAIQSLITKD